MQQNLKSCWCFWEFWSAWYFNFKIFSIVRTRRKICPKIPWTDFIKEFLWKNLIENYRLVLLRFEKTGINLMLRKVVLKSKPERFLNIHAGCYQYKTFWKFSDMQSILVLDVFQEMLSSQKLINETHILLIWKEGSDLLLQNLPMCDEYYLCSIYC